MKEKLRELYQNGQAGITPCISANGLLKAVANGWITLDDAVEIIGSEDTLPIVRAAKLKEISIACNETIVNGVDLTLDGETVHFNLSTEDQANIANLFRVVELGGTEFHIRLMVEFAVFIQRRKSQRFTLLRKHLLRHRQHITMN